ncbi:MAG TPA: hypothetical protein VJC18_10560, partial [bacterium]|nr:hypothetical protein [bacterium]
MYQAIALILLAVALIIFMPKRHPVFYVSAGIVAGLSFFSSVASAPIFPFFLAALVYHVMSGDVKNGLKAFLWVFLGGAAVVIWICSPDIPANLLVIFSQVEASKMRSHFNVSQPDVIQWVLRPDLTVRGGFRWVAGFGSTLLPVFSVVFCAAVMVFLLTGVKAFLKRHWQWDVWVLLLLGLLPLLMTEYKQVAQLSRSYLPSFVGLIFVCALALRVFLKEWWPGLNGSWRRLA